jgi:hypothetical protein
MSNLPKTSSNDSAAQVKAFFENYYNEPINLAANDIDSVVGFFKKRGFDDSAAISTAATLLKQAKIDNVKIYKLIDTLQGLTDIQLSALVTEVLNYNRPRVSTLGYKVSAATDNFEARNIII